MTAPSSETRSTRSRPVIRNINVGDLARYRLPLPGIVSILHRASGALLFVMLWLLLWLLQASVSDHAEFRALYANPLVKLILFALLWSLLHHLCAGIRYLVMDVNHAATDLKAARQSASIVVLVSLLLTAIVGVRLW
jgi:succinate dehydrogenase / fumarate reductase cytochrome b subunit